MDSYQLVSGSGTAYQQGHTGQSLDPRPQFGKKGREAPAAPHAEVELQPANTAWKYGRRVAATQQGKHCSADHHCHRATPALPVRRRSDHLGLSGGGETCPKLLL